VGHLIIVLNTNKRRFDLHTISGYIRAKISKVTLDALKTRQSLVKGERLERHEMRTVPRASPDGTRNTNENMHNAHPTKHTSQNKRTTSLDNPAVNNLKTHTQSINKYGHSIKKT